MIELDDEEQRMALQDIMTPMIDVIFVLIAFMMLMINVPLQVMEVNLPAADESTSLSSSDKHLAILAVKSEGPAWLLDDQEIESNDSLYEQLTMLKTAHGEQLEIVVQSDREAPMERVVTLFSILQKLDLEVANLALQRSGEG